MPTKNDIEMDESVANIKLSFLVKATVRNTQLISR